MQLIDQEVPLQQLLLDPNNYRYQDISGYVSASPSRFHEESVQRVAFERLRSAGLTELKNSIVTNGFLPFERIVVRPYADHEDDLYLVVEGNRRVAALRWLKADHDAGVPLDDDLLEVFDKVPVTVVTPAGDQDADESFFLSLMGVRHVGGIKEWGGYQRAKLVTELRDTYSLDTSEVAARLGMTAHEVNRRYRAFKALQQMINHEEFGEFATPNLYPIFHEAVAGTAVKEWLGWNEDTAEFENEESVVSFYELITPTEREEDGEREPPKLSTYQTVRELRDILPVPEARRALFDPGQSFHDALAIAKAESLSRTWLAQIGEAIAALRSIGALDLQSLNNDEIDEIRRLRQTADQLLLLNERLAVEPEATQSE